MLAQDNTGQLILGNLSAIAIYLRDEATSNLWRLRSSLSLIYFTL